MKQTKLLFYLLIMLLALPSLLFSQQRTVSGRVTDSSNSPLADATVSVVGKSVNTKTKSDGSFTINVPSGSNQLRVTYVGYQDQTVSITSDNLTVNMTASNQSLSEVVVVGYGTARRKDLTGSTASVREKDFNKGVLLHLTS
ncbi:MAG: carboxypeptidase-like regulatory domain-containing protein [Segetibacter sp.]